MEQAVWVARVVLHASIILAVVNGTVFLANIAAGVRFDWWASSTPWWGYPWLVIICMGGLPGSSRVD
jgi:hypothetical protein